MENQSCPNRVDFPFTVFQLVEKVPYMSEYGHLYRRNESFLEVFGPDHDWKQVSNFPNGVHFREAVVNDLELNLKNDDIEKTTEHTINTNDLMYRHEN